MINKSAEYFENMAGRLGLSIKIPRLSQGNREVFSVTNGLAGIGLISSGIIFRKTSLMVLGAIGVAGAAALVLDGRKNQP